MSVPVLRGSVAPASAGSRGGDLLVLLPSLGTTTQLWSDAVAALQRRVPALRVLTIDLPGHGASPAAHDDFTAGELADAVLRIIDEVGGGRFHLAGVSFGGVVSLELALTHPERVLSLGLIATGAKIGDAAGWASREQQALASGTASLVGGSAERWFAPGFLDGPRGGAGARALSLLLDVDDASYARVTRVLGGFDRRAELGSLSMPVFVTAGADDAVTTPDAMRELADAVPGARFEVLTGTAHLPPLEVPDAVAELLAEQVAAPAAGGADAGAGADAHVRGMRVRREVLGDAHVDAAIAATTAETAAFQDFITRYAWGDVWARPGLGRRERSIATLAVLAADGHEHELRMHVRAALRNGLTRDEIAEVLLHTALYAGLPPVNRALTIAREVFAEPAPRPVE